MSWFYAFDRLGAAVARFIGAMIYSPTEGYLTPVIDPDMGVVVDLEYGDDPTRDLTPVIDPDVGAVVDLEQVALPKDEPCSPGRDLLLYEEFMV